MLLLVTHDCATPRSNHVFGLLRKDGEERDARRGREGLRPRRRPEFTKLSWCSLRNLRSRGPRRPYLLLLGRLLLLGAGCAQDVRHRIVPFVTRVFEQAAVGLGHRRRDGPRFREYPRIVDRELVINRVRVDPSEALDEFPAGAEC